MKKGFLKKLRRFFPRSFSAQMLISIFAVIILLSFSSAYLVVSFRNLQKVSERLFERERFIRFLQGELGPYQTLLLEYLSTRSSNALAQILIRAQRIRGMLPAFMPVTAARAAADAVELRERELYSLIRSYLDLADRAMENKRGRNIAAYTQIYDETVKLLEYINSEIGIISSGQYRNQMNSYGVFIAASGKIQLLNLLFIIFISIFAILLLLHSVGKITDPMLRLSGMAAELSAGHFSIADIESETVSEMDQVVAAFNRMKNEIRNYIGELRRQENIKEEYLQEKMRNMNMESLVRRMEIYALQAQMNPHFLFNALNTGMQLAIVEGADRTSEYMEYMAKLFRHIIRNKEVFVPLEHEIQGLRYYFYILKVRFPNNLDLALDCDESLAAAVKVPVSILQPLVENCVIHAFRENPDGKRSLIMVRGELRDRRLILTVRDNGRGMDTDTVNQLLHPLSLDESSLSRVMGLENVIQRLYFFYPDDPEVVRIETAPGEGTAVIISINTEREPCIAF
jgi:sensor histidine kinase YesM